MTDPSNRNIQLVWRSGNEVALKLVELGTAVCESLREAGVLHTVGTEPAEGTLSRGPRHLRLVHGNQVVTASTRETIP